MKLALKPENLAQLVFFIRGEKVMLAQHLAELDGVPVRALNQAVKRNIKRFPADFMFQLTKDEFERLKSQFVISNGRNRSPRSQNVISSWGGLRRALPYAFTEQGVAMLSSVLRSKRAVEVNIAIMRTFVQLRRLMDTNRDLARKIEALEKKYDEQHSVRGRRWIDCIGRPVKRPSVSGEGESIRRGFCRHQRTHCAPSAAKKTDRLSSLNPPPTSDGSRIMDHGSQIIGFLPTPFLLFSAL